MTEYTAPLTTQEAREIGQCVQIDKRITENIRYTAEARANSAAMQQKLLTVLHADALAEYAIA